ncbi:MAG: hypothetical protein C0505_14260 [Leptothrix sp. (in: Bacteria)]|nr:hypothetical protein [Leptothrix sp. (in: b-proteobacteria)]
MARRVSELRARPLTADDDMLVLLLDNRGLQASSAELGITEAACMQAPNRAAEPVVRETTPAFEVTPWGINGQSPGPTDHRIHLYGHEFTVAGTDGGPTPRGPCKSPSWCATTR